MNTDPRRTESPLATDPEPSDGEAIRNEIEHVREDLGETVDALSKKADVTAQASAKTVPVIAAAIALLVVAWMVRRRRNR